MKILQINVTSNTGSTGRITELLGESILKQDNESYIAYSRKGLPSSSSLITIGSKVDILNHVLITRLFDRHGFASKNATLELIKKIKNINPDCIHLHNVHGYYLHIAELFSFLKEFNKPVIWTFHDCWSFTGHCAHFEDIQCVKWQTQCYNCPKTKRYPKSLFIDNSKRNYKDKKILFSSLNKMMIVTPSHWLKKLVKQSFLSEFPVQVIYNGIDVEKFTIQSSLSLKKKLALNSGQKVILGVASVWTEHKGLCDFLKVERLLSPNFKIILLGLSDKQIKRLPSSMIGIKRTESIEELISFYNIADVYVNPTYSDTFPTTNLEALACGTPVITYNTGGSPEAIDGNTGIVVNKGDIEGIMAAIEKILSGTTHFSPQLCRQRAEKYFNKDDRYSDYIDLYKKLIKR